MAVVAVNQNYLEKKVGLKEKEIIEYLSSMGFPTEVEEKQYLVEVTPDRPDMYFTEGIIRALNSYCGLGQIRRYVGLDSEYSIISDSTVKKVVPYISAFVAKDVDVSEEELKDLIEAQEKLHNTIGRKRKKCSMGIYNLEKIEFPLEYKVVKEYEFVPLDSNEKMGLGQILEEHPTGREYAHLVEKGKYPVIIEKNSGKVVAFPPIINSEETRLEKGTRNIFMEATGIHKEITEKVVSMFACVFVDVGAKIYNVKINREIHPKLEYSEWKVDEKKTNKIIGSKFSKKEIEKGLVRMGYSIERGRALCPPYRVDMIDYVDIIEDIAIGIGYDKLVPTLPDFYTCGNITKRTEEDEKIREIMNGMGFLEVVTSSLVDERRVLDKGNALKITNPCSEECGYVRDSLLSSILMVLGNNKMGGLPQKYYEIGLSYVGMKEKKSVGFVVMDRKVDLNEVRGYLQRLLKERKVEYKMSVGDRENCENAIEIKMNGKNGWLGKLSREILEREGIVFEVVYGEIQL